MPPCNGTGGGITDHPTIALPVSVAVANSKEEAEIIVINNRLKSLNPKNGNSTNTSLCRGGYN